MKKRITPILTLILVLLINFSYSQNNTPDKEFDEVKFRAFHSNILDEERNLYIYAPIDANTKKYPVIYMLDAEMAAPYGLILDYIKTNPHIIVGIGTRENRNRDMFPVKLANRRNSGGGANFLNFITTELKPFIGQNYKTNGNDILFGASNAGLFTIYTMLTEPNQFNSYISLSPTIGYCNEFLIDLVNKTLTPEVLNGKNLYILYGLKNEMPQVTQYVPAYTKLLKTTFPKLNIYSKGLEKEGHVPMDGFQGGLKFIYNE